ATARSTPEPDEESAPEGNVDQHVVLLSGLSGGGKTDAAQLFEDLGYTVVDNLPGELLPELAELVSDEPERFDKVAIVLDVRSGDAPVAFSAMRGALEGRGIRPQVFFLEARDEVLIRRFSETRHRHPLADQRGIASSIAEERRLLDPVRSDADVVIDTSDLSLRELRERIFARLGDATDPARIAVLHTHHRSGPARDPAHQLRLQVRRPAGGRPRVRRPVHAEPVLHRRAPPDVGPDRGGPRLRPGPARRTPVPGLPPRVPRLRAAGLRRRGQDAAHDRAGLHRRLPPLDRPGRGAGSLAPGAGLRAGRGLPPGARACMTWATGSGAG